MPMRVQRIVHVVWVRCAVFVHLAHHARMVYLCGSGTYREVFGVASLFLCAMCSQVHCAVILRCEQRCSLGMC